MQTIILYVFIILIGFFIAKKNFIPNSMKSKISHFQTAALYFLLAFMGYKIGANDNIINNLSQLGLQAIVITIFAIVFSILLVFLIYRGGQK
ncbi:LysO family transporter [uncultured Fusobacterium sp.]|uniref:LysO family transporter n=1 Tax=uncultured Fusobacterium sp. TaxID=159267 RepID=UPI0025CDF62C|nr:LysO family transporter [uncultured Fusobacterium sp.]